MSSSRRCSTRGCSVARDRQDGFERLTVTEKKGAGHTLLVYYEDVLNPEQCATADGGAVAGGP